MFKMGRIAVRTLFKPAIRANRAKFDPVDIISTPAINNIYRVPIIMDASVRGRVRHNMTIHASTLRIYEGLVLDTTKTGGNTQGISIDRGSGDKAFVNLIYKISVYTGRERNDNWPRQRSIDSNQKEPLDNTEEKDQRANEAIPI